MIYVTDHLTHSIPAQSAGLRVANMSYEDWRKHGKPDALCDFWTFAVHKDHAPANCLTVTSWHYTGPSSIDVYFGPLWLFDGDNVSGVERILDLGQVGDLPSSVDSVSRPYGTRDDDEIFTFGRGAIKLITAGKGSRHTIGTGMISELDALGFFDQQLHMHNKPVVNGNDQHYNYERIMHREKFLRKFNMTNFERSLSHVKNKIKDRLLTKLANRDVANIT